MTPEEIKQLAYSILGDWGINVEHTPNALMYDRMSSRQRELFAWVNALNPDYFGECAVAGIVDNAYVNLDSLEVLTQGPYPVDTIQVVRIADPGTSDYISGQRVRIVRIDDWRELAPRMTYRSRVLRGIGDDMVGVVSITVWYTRRPRPIGPDGSGVIELPEPWHDLLALDLARFLLQHSPDDVAPCLAYIDAEESQRMKGFETHINASYRALEARLR